MKEAGGDCIVEVWAKNEFYFILYVLFPSFHTFTAAAAAGAFPSLFVRLCVEQAGRREGGWVEECIISSHDTHGKWFDIFSLRRKFSDSLRSYVDMELPPHATLRIAFIDF